MLCSCGEARICVWLVHIGFLFVLLIFFIPDLFFLFHFFCVYSCYHQLPLPVVNVFLVV
eukprot:NODE_10448_length_335_cov_12.248252_g9536_i0.p1 GENE.NODE_10448_length_335_cov_12.248252_g9536_i0~~NODE_10448_length_335_cov_12.248252_g9536_i0.p1  ORF type:complete len:59 (+),score=2.83 NODE_10448_length_335_cov_12.248252_g9536_i0:120-296(+)